VTAPELAPDGLPIRVAARYFEVHYGAALRNTPYQGQDLIFKVAAAAPDEMPPEPQLLKVKIEHVVDRVLSAVKDSGKKENYVQEIGSLARTGLESGQLTVASTGLSAFVERFVRNEGTILRAKYIKDMGKIGIIVGLPALVLGWIIVLIGNFKTVSDSNLNFTREIAGAGMFVLFGICLGATLSAFLRNRSIDFENIGYFDTDGFDPGLRYSFLCLVAIIFGILLYKGWLIVGITQQLVLNSFVSDSGIAIILGVITGYAEPNITRLVTGGLEAVRDRRSGS
jgi:hypothetical protein